MKRLLAVLLAFALALTMVLPVLAEEEDEIDPHMPVIKLLQPESLTREIQSKRNTFRLSVVANIPYYDTTPAELYRRNLIGYQWYAIEKEGDAPKPLTGGTDKENWGEFRSKGGDYPDGAKFYVVIYNPADSTAEEGPHRVQSETITLEIAWSKLSLPQKLLQGILMIPQLILMVPALIVFAFVFPPFPGLLIFALPFLPFVYLYNWIGGLFK